MAIEIKRPGALTKKAKGAGEGVQSFAKAHYHSKGLTGKQARFAVIAKGWKHGGRKSSRKSSRS